MELEKIRSLASESWIFLNQDELYSPLALVVGGVIVLVLGQMFKKFAEYQMAKGAGHWAPGTTGRDLLNRFERRAKFSWFLILFGTVWLSQMVVEKVFLNRIFY